MDSLADLRQMAESLGVPRGCTLLSELSLAGCKNVDLSTLPELQSLTVLHLEHSNVRDLSVLTAQPALKTVTVSIDMLPLTFPEKASFSVVLVP